MTQNDADGRDRSILLVGHGLMPEPPEAADQLVEWAGQSAVELLQLPVPAFVARPSEASGRLATPQVAERLAELDALESLFERIADYRAGGARILGLIIPPGFTANRSGRAWVDRVRAIARGIADLSLPVWTATEADLSRSGLVAAAAAG